MLGAGPLPAIATRAASAARIDSGLALYASLTTVTPSGRSVTSIRHRETGSAAPSAAATPGGVPPSSSATAAAARALPTWCSPRRGSVTGARPAGLTRVKRARPPSSTTSSARTCAAGPRPNVTTRAGVRTAIAATAASSAFSTATPSAGSASTSSPLATAVAAREPNSPRWALPTLSTTPIRGGTAAASPAMCRGPLAAYSSTRCRVVASARSAVQGRPSSLLNEPGGATVGPSGARTAARRSLVEVFPELPVTPTTVVPGSARTAWPASRASAASTAAPVPSRSAPAR